jgi:hypothetical protein
MRDFVGLVFGFELGVLWDFRKKAQKMSYKPIFIGLLIKKLSHQSIPPPPAQSPTPSKL